VSLRLDIYDELIPKVTARAVRRNELAGDYAKVAQTACQREAAPGGAEAASIGLARIAENGVIEDVEEMCREHSMETLGNCCVLSEGSVQIPVPESSEGPRPTGTPVRSQQQRP